MLNLSICKLVSADPLIQGLFGLLELQGNVRDARTNSAGGPMANSGPRDCLALKKGLPHVFFDIE